ncbi:MAG: hypothetical protein AAFX40_03115 [Cyanobacteria bacterium J06639_1]
MTSLSLGLLSGCGTQLSTSPEVDAPLVSAPNASNAAAVAAIFEDDNAVRLEDVAELLAAVNLSGLTDRADDLQTAALQLVASEVDVSIEEPPSLANADVAQPVNVLDMTDVAVVVAALDVAAGERTEVAIAARASQLLAEPVPPEAIRVIPGVVRLGSAGQPGGAAVVAPGQGANATSSQAIAAIDRLPSITTNASNIVFPPGSAISFPAPPNRERALRVSYRPRLMASRNGSEVEYSAAQLKCEDNVCDLAGIPLIPEGFEAGFDDYLITYTFRIANGDAIASVQRYLTQIEQPTLVELSSFQVGNRSVALGFDTSTETIWTYSSSAPELTQFSSAGDPSGSVTRPGESSDDFDLTFASETLNLGNTAIAPNTLLAINGETDLADIYAIDTETGAVLASLEANFGNSHVVGGDYHPDRDTFFLVQDRVPPSDSEPNVIAEIDSQDGSRLNSFSVLDVLSSYSVNFGDLAVGNNGNLFVVSSIQSTVLELTPEGVFVREFALPAGVGSLSGIGFDRDRGSAWVVNTGNTVWQLDGFPETP